VQLHFLEIVLLGPYRPRASFGVFQEGLHFRALSFGNALLDFIEWYIVGKVITSTFQEKYGKNFFSWLGRRFGRPKQKNRENSVFGLVALSIFFKFLDAFCVSYISLIVKILSFCLLVRIKRQNSRFFVKIWKKHRRIGT